MRAPRVLLAAALLLASAVPLLPPTLAAQDACGAPPAAAPLDAEEQAAVDAINAMRAAEGLPPLTVSATLNRAARSKAVNLAGGAPFSHDDGWRSWQQRLADCGYSTRVMVSENLAAGVDTGPEAVRMWEGSPPHRANMLDPGARGVGIARSGGGGRGWYWTANFGGE